MKPDKHQKSKQIKRSQDFCWKVQDRGQYFVLRSYPMHKLDVSIRSSIRR